MSDCACVAVDTYDGPSFYNSTTRTARKAHRCDECHRAIARGEQYEHVAGCWDGSIDTFKTCADCVSVREAFFCKGFLHGSMWCDFGEHLHEVVVHGEGVAGSCIAKLTPAARDRVCDAIEELWNKYFDEEED